MVFIRGNGLSTYADGLKKGYLLSTKRDSNNKIILNAHRIDGDSITELMSFNTGIAVLPGNHNWFRSYGW